MAYKNIEMGTIKHIQRLSENGISIKEITRQMGLSRNTVRKYVRTHSEDPKPRGSEIINTENNEAADDDNHKNERLKKFNRYLSYFEKELRKRGVTKQLLWFEYKSKEPEGYAYSQFCYHLQQYLKRNTATLHIEQKPGDKLYVDFAGEKMEIINRETGEITKAEVFIATLGYSGFTYVQACKSQQKEDYINCLENTLRYLGGVPLVIVPDNLKSAVTKADKYEPEINRNLEEFSEHYGVGILPARSRKPRDKAWVERMVSIVYTRIYAPLRNHEFYDIETLNDAIWEKLDDHNNMLFQDKPYSRTEIFERDEKHLLKALATEKYRVKEYAYVRVMKNSHVQLRKDRHYYSVPYQHIGKKIKIAYSIDHVQVFYQHEQIAFHLRDTRPYKYTTVAAHLPSTHRLILDWSPEKFISQAARISAVVENYITKILNKNYYPEQSYRSCMGIFNLGRKYGNERLINACTRADYYGNYGYKIIENILKKNYDKLPLTLNANKEQLNLPFHENIRGADQYK